MANDDKLSFSWELRGTLEKQIKDAIKDADKLKEAISKAAEAGEKVDPSKFGDNFKKNVSEAERALYKLMDAREKAEQALSRNASRRKDSLFSFDESRLSRSVYVLNDIIDKIMNIGVAAVTSKNAVKNLLAETSADVVLKGVRGETSDLNKQIEKKEKEEIKAARDAAKEIAKAQADEEEAAARNAAAQEKVKDALARIATARSQLHSVSERASVQEQMHVQLLLSLLDRLSQKLAALKGTNLGAKGALTGVLGSGYQGLMRNVGTAIKDLQSGTLNGLGMSDAEWERNKALAEQARRRREITNAVNEQAAAEARVEAVIQMRQHKLQMERAREEREEAKAVEEVNRALEEKAQKERRAAQATREQAQANQGLANAYDRAVEAGSRQSRLLTQLQQQLAGYFGLYAGEHFIKNLIQIGGEFEVQHIALQNILGDVQQANSMFEQMKELAVVSPFNFRQLAGYAKQVAAFNVPYNEMFDTTKRLADISAGLGVDMGRLILAFGQVRSAAVLRGQELRQFTEAGIPMVQALANEFTKLNGRAVSTAEVFELISKRAVPFEMVKKILWDMTNEGGRFFDTQFVLADTLAGKWSNLQDAWEIMLSEIADGTSIGGRSLKYFVSLTTSLIENLNKLLPIITMVTTSIGLIKLKNYANTFTNLGFKGIDKNIESAQRLRAIELTRQKINGDITGQKYAQLMRMNAQKANYYQVLAMEGRLNAMQIQRVYQQGNLNKKQLEYLVLMGRITAEQRKQIIQGQISTTVFARMGNAIKGFGKNIWGATGWMGVFMIALDAAVVGLLSWKGHLDEIERKNKDLADSFGKRGSGLTESLSGMTSTPANADEYKSAIDGMKEMLKQHSASYGAIMREVNALSSLEEQYKKLKEELKETNKLYSIAEDIAPEFGEQTRDLFDNAKTKLRNFNKSFWKDSNHFNRALDETANDIAKIIKDFLPDVGKDKRSNELYRQLRNAMEEELGYGGKERMQLNIKLDEILNITGGGEVSNLVLEKFSDAVDLSEKSIANKMRFGQELNKAERDKVQELMNAAIKDVEKQYPYLRDTLQGLLNDSNFTATVSVMFAENNLGNELQQQIYKNFPSVVKEKVKTIATNWSKNNTSVYDARNAAKRDIDETYNELVARRDMLKKRKITAEEVQKTENEYKDKVTAALVGLGYDYEGEKKKSNKGNGGKKGDQQLKRWREEWNELKSFYSEFKRWAQFIGDDAALKKLRETGLWGQLFKQDGTPKYDMKNWGNAIKDFRKQLSGGSVERDKFIFEVDKEQLNPEYDQAKEFASGILKQLDVALKEQGKRWDLYKRILDATGSKSQAGAVAFGGDVNFGNYAESLRSDIEKYISSLPDDKKVSVDELIDMSIDPKKLRDYGIMEGSTNGIWQKLMLLREEMSKVKAEEVDFLLDALKNAKSLDTELDQIRLRADRARDSIRKNYTKDGVLTAEGQNLLNNIDANEARDIADKRWEYFKKTEDWGRIFGNLDKVSAKTLNGMLSKLRELAPQLSQSAESTKALYEAMAKVEKVVGERNPFATIQDALQQSRALSKIRNSAPNSFKQIGGWSLTPEQARAAGLDVKESGEYSEKDLEDGERGIRSLFNSGIEGLVKKLKSVQDALQPVITLFDKLGNTTLGKIFKTGSDMLGSAASMASGAVAAFGPGAGIWGAAVGAGLSFVSSIIGDRDTGAWESASRYMQNIDAVVGRIHNDLQEQIRIGNRTADILRGNRASMENIERRRDAYYDAMKGWFGSGAGTGAHSWAYEINNWFKANSLTGIDESRWSYKINEYLKSKGYEGVVNVIQDFEQMDGKWLKMVYEKFPDFIALLPEDLRKVFENIIDLEKEAEEEAKNVVKALSGLDTDELISEWAGLMDTLDYYNEDFAQSFEKRIRNAIINGMIANQYKEQIQELIDTASKSASNEYYLSTDGTVKRHSKKDDEGNWIDEDVASEYTREELDVLRSMKDPIVNGVTDTAKMIDDIMDWDIDGKNSGGGSSIKSISEETAGLLASYVNAIRADVSVNRVALNSILQEIVGQREMPALAQAQIAQLEIIARNTGRNADLVQEIRDIMHQNVNGGNGFHIA
jgi:hypothetical protein